MISMNKYRLAAAAWGDEADEPPAAGSVAGAAPSAASGSLVHYIIACHSILRYIVV